MGSADTLSAKRIKQFDGPMRCHRDPIGTHAKRRLLDDRLNDSVGLAIERRFPRALNSLSGPMSGQPVECRRPSEGSIHAKQRAIVSDPIGDHVHHIFRSASRFSNGQTPVNDLSPSQSHATQGGRAIDSDDLQVEVNQTASDFISTSRKSGISSSHPSSSTPGAREPISRSLHSVMNSVSGARGRCVPAHSGAGAR